MFELKFFNISLLSSAPWLTYWRHCKVHHWPVSIFSRVERRFTRIRFSYIRLRFEILKLRVSFFRWQTALHVRRWERTDGENILRPLTLRVGRNREWRSDGLRKWEIESFNVGSENCFSMRTMYWKHNSCWEYVCVALDVLEIMHVHDRSHSAEFAW